MKSASFPDEYIMARQEETREKGSEHMTREEKKEVLEAFERFPEDVKYAFAVGRAFAELEREAEKATATA